MSFTTGDRSPDPPASDSGQEKSNGGRSVRAMERLVSAVQELSLARSLEAIQGIVRTVARELTGADGATFVLRDGNYCHYVDEDAISPLWKGKRFPLENCISGWTMLNAQCAIIEDIYADPRIPIDAYRPTFVKSLAMVPIRSQAPVGAIGNYWASRHRPSDEEVRLLSALADTTAVAMENVRAFTALEERVRERTFALQAANEQIQRLSVTDDLTGVYNRRGFLSLAERGLKRARREGTRPAVVFIDLDGLKQVNDAHGHDVGDELIVRAARAFTETMRDTDILGRLGGDEFCVFLQDQRGCTPLIQRLRQAMERPDDETLPYRFSASIGVAASEDASEALDVLLSRADAAIYAEKRAKRAARE